MELPDDIRATLFAAGAGALPFNAPLGADRARALVSELGRFEPRFVVDLGCGRGEFVRLLASELRDATVIGVDTDRAAIEVARRLTEEANLTERARFEIADAATWPGPMDAAVCVGASHAFGGPAAMFARLAELVRAGAAIVGDGVWEAEPDHWCLEAFGDLPVGADELAHLATDAGWTVHYADLSTLAEWDVFEGVWAEGVRLVGTLVAETFADEREREYRDHYRAVLGFCWLTLSR